MMLITACFHKGRKPLDLAWTNCRLLDVRVLWPEADSHPCKCWLRFLCVLGYRNGRMYHWLLTHFYNEYVNTTSARSAKQIATASCLFAWDRTYLTNRCVDDIEWRTPSLSSMNNLLAASHLWACCNWWNAPSRWTCIARQPKSVWCPHADRAVRGNAFARKYYNALSMNLTLSWHTQRYQSLRPISKVRRYNR